MSLFGKIVHAAEDVGKAVGHAAEGVGKAVGHTAEDVGKAVGHAAQAGAKVAGQVIDAAGMPVKFVIDGVAHVVGDITGIHMRGLTAAEKTLVKSAFGHTVPVNKILITSISGAGGRPFTVPGSMVVAGSAAIPGIGPVLALAGMIEHLQDKYLINFGKGNYPRLIPSQWDGKNKVRAGATLVHESCHVWQGVSGAFSWSYVFNSLYYQCTCGKAAYNVPGVSDAGVSGTVRTYTVDRKSLKPWVQLHAEQQAHVVEIWFTRGASKTDVLYAYIHDNVAANRPHAATHFLTDRELVAAGHPATGGKVLLHQPTLFHPRLGPPAAHLHRRH